MKLRWWPAILGLGYITLIGLLGGLRIDHVILGSFFILDYIHPKTRTFLTCIFPLLLTAALFDSMRYYYWPGIEGHIHVAEPYFRDLSWFGVWDNGQRITPNEFFQK